MTAPHDLAERIERADGPERALDAEIATAMGWTMLERKNENVTIGRDPDGRWQYGIPAYTASIDAAQAQENTNAPAR